MSARPNGQRWKLAARIVADTHLEQGTAILSFTENPPLAESVTGFEDLTPEELLYVVPDRQINPKDVRRMLWNNRNVADLQNPDPNLVIWTYYDHEDNQSLIGLGRLQTTRSESQEQPNG